MLAALSNAVCVSAEVYNELNQFYRLISRLLQVVVDEFDADGVGVGIRRVDGVLQVHKGGSALPS